MVVPSVIKVESHHAELASNIYVTDERANWDKIQATFLRTCTELMNQRSVRDKSKASLLRTDSQFVQIFHTHIKLFVKG